MTRLPVTCDCKVFFTFAISAKGVLKRNLKGALSLFCEVTDVYQILVVEARLAVVEVHPIGFSCVHLEDYFHQNPKNRQ